VAANYTRQIEFKVKDTEIRRATDRIVSSLKKIEDSLGRIERGGFNKLGRDATKAGTRIDKLRTKVAGFEKLAQGMLRTGQGRRATFLGFLGLGATFNELDRSVASVGAKITNLSRAFNPFSKNVEIATAKAGVFSTKLHALTAFAAGHPVAVGAMAVAYMAFGDVMEKIARKAIPSVLMGIDALGKKALIATGLWKGLNEEVIRFNKGSVLRGVHRSRAGRAGSGYGAWSAQAGEYNPYNMHPGHLRSGVHAASGVGFDNVSERLQFGLTSAQAGRGDMYMRGGVYGPMPASPYRLDSQYDIATQKAIARHAKKHLPKIDKSTAKAAAILSQQSAQKLLAPAAGPTGFTAAQYGPARASWTQRLGIGKKASPTGMFASPTGMGGRLKGGIGSALIGGGFPMLFGQGPVAAAGGALGGLGGGMLGGMFGFGGSLVGSLIGQKIEEAMKFNESIRELGNEMRLMGHDAGFSSKQIEKLAKQLNLTKEEALEVARGFKRYGAKEGGLFAEYFGGDAALLEAMAKATDIESAMDAIRKTSKDLTVEEELRYRIMLQNQGVEATINQLLEERIRRRKGEKLEDQRERAVGVGKWGMIGVLYNQIFQARKFERELDELLGEDSELRTNFEKLKEDMMEIELSAEKTAQSITTAIEAVEKDLRKLMNPQYQIVEMAKSIDVSFQEAFKGMIRGSMSAQQALASMFQRTANAFLDMAAQMLAAQIRARILGIFGSMFGFTGGGKGVENTGLDVSAGSDMANYSKKAAGGPVSDGTPYIVGEKGPELFVPNSSGNIVPNHAMGGSMVVNVDASGSSVEGDDDRSRQLGELIGAAVQSEIVRQQRPGGTLY
jgi:hypothetical protein